VLRYAALGAALALGACHAAVLDPQGTIGQADKTILVDTVAIMLAIVVPTILATLAFAWWFRASNERAQHYPQWAFSGRLEIIVWSIPLLTIMLLGGVAWIGSHELDPAKPLPSKTPALEVQGVSLDWKWLFIYPDQHVASVNQLVIPVNTPIHFSLTSASVMSAFFIPRLGSMIYTMNGMTTKLYLDANAAGTFLGRSSHYNGDGFSDMHFEVHAVPAAAFTSWVAATRASGPTLDDASYKSLEQQSINVQPYTYREADPALFGDIVSQKLPPGPGPSKGRPTADVTPRTEP
jgi:cytochrome o ubiquinol oxidase subunit 2